MATPDSFQRMGLKLVKLVISSSIDAFLVVLSRFMWSLHSSPLRMLVASVQAQLSHGGPFFLTLIEARSEARFVSHSTLLCLLAPA